MTKPVAQLDAVQKAQEERYELPYHYIPSLHPGKFSQHVYWDWGFRYLGGLQLVMENLREMPFESLVDIGCGDGRFLREVQQAFPGRRLMGIDYSPRAIGLATVLNPGLRFACLDIVQQTPEEPFDVGTLIEVIEHIEPDRLPEFVSAVRRWLKERHTLLITAPHVNKPMISKHYQHFNEAGLRALLEQHYRQLRFIPFDARTSQSPGLRFMQALLGGRGKLFLITNRRLLHAFFRWYLRHYLRTRSERDCERIAVICRT